VDSTSKAGINMGSGHSFWKWHYITAKASLAKSVNPEAVCLDTGCMMTLIDYHWLIDQAPDMKICKMASPIMVKGIGSDSYSSSDYTQVLIQMDGVLPNRKAATAQIPTEVHLVDSLKVWMLIGVDTLGPKAINISVAHKIATIGACKNVEVPICYGSTFLGYRSKAGEE
jgi:hypothetical protein